MADKNELNIFSRGPEAQSGSSPDGKALLSLHTEPAVLIISVRFHLKLSSSITCKAVLVQQKGVRKYWLLDI